MTETTDRSIEEELERARSDYLAVSRGAHLFSTPADHAEAEERAWERLERALQSAETTTGS